ncbi:hypothetical protein Q4F19_16720 [Sphingomonas sp. BIUV-7]|uniref:Uncharacterized protein n=2 Tax=Sphingomonas natans TaxID=3063330 RepID=A0ABT8YCH8_9SPHN|nr:hypothetical protein [Sphingomonas sp. BIUV-7]
MARKGDCAARHNGVSMPTMQHREDQTPPSRPAWHYVIRRTLVWASFVSLLMWAVLLSLIFTGHTKIIWTVEKAAHVTERVVRKAHREVGRLQGDHGRAP